MTKLELLTSKMELMNKANSLINTCESEKRMLNSAEDATVKEIRKQIADIDAEVAKIDANLTEEKRKADADLEKKNIEIRKNMENTFNFGLEIRNRLDNPSLDKTFKVPAFENRAASQYSVTADDGTKGGEVVPTTLTDMVLPIYDNQVMGNFTSLTGVTGDLKIPALSKNSAMWVSEIAEASKSDSTITGQTLKPFRIAVYTDVSDQLIMQADSNIEQIIKNDLVSAMRDKIQATILGAEAASEDHPAGLFYNAGSIASVNYENLCTLEENLEEKNITDVKYIIGPKTKLAGRTTLKSAGVAGYLFENGELNGLPTAVTNACPGILAGQLENVLFAIWKDVDITLDTVTRKLYGETRIIMNAYVGWVVRRPEAVVAKTVGE